MTQIPVQPAKQTMQLHPPFNESAIDCGQHKFNCCPQAILFLQAGLLPARVGRELVS